MKRLRYRPDGQHKEAEMRYYSTQRPITPGSIPEPRGGNQIIAVVNFDEPQEIEGKGRVYGIVTYLMPLTTEQWMGAELIPESYRQFFGAVLHEIPGRPETRTGGINKVVVAESRPDARTQLSERTGRLTRQRWFTSMKEAADFLMTGEEAVQ